MKHPVVSSIPGFEAALRELGIVHRSDQARLLRAACALACGRSRSGRHYVAGFEHAPGGSTRQRARAAWDRDCAEEIATARADGFAVHPWLPRLLDRPTARWPRPSRIARAALALREDHGGRLDLARASLVEGDVEFAIRALGGLFEAAARGPERSSVLEALALAHEAHGDLAVSLSCYARATREPRSVPRVAVALLALALRVGSPPDVALAARRLSPLDLSIAGTRRRFDRALLAARGRAGGASRPRTANPWPILEMALSGSGACSEVARSLV